MSIVGSNVLAGASGQGGYFLENSLRFRSSVNGDLYRDVTTTGNRKTFTYSCWLKITKVDTTQIFSCGTSGSSVLQARIVTNNGLQIYQESGGATNFQRYTGSSAYLRDFSAWYHIVFAVDTTQATAGDRVKVYLNGIQLTSFSSSVDPSLNYDTLANYNDMWVGSYLGTVTSDTYQTEVHFLDGYAATANDFGEFDGATGVWKPKEYVGGNYGTNGFYLPMTPTTQAELQNTVKFNSTTATAKKVTGVGFSPDLIWFKSTSNAQNHYLIDTVRGGNSFIYSNANNAQNTSQQWIDEFGSDGFTATNNVLSNNYDYIAWCWDAGANQASTGHSSVEYMGSGVSKKVTGFGFSPDLVWIKANNATRGWRIYDSVRGATKGLSSDGSGAEYTESGLTSFDADGYTAGTHAGINAANEQFYAWGWDAGNGDPVTNTQGDINSTLKANDATGFSIVTWTGSGVSDDRVGHGLNSAPEVVIYKDRNGTDRWYVWTTVIDGSADYLFLDGTNAANNLAAVYTAPTATTISNFGYGASKTVVAYCFKSVSGVSDIGTYTGTGATGKVITTGFRPGFLMIKRTDSTGNWVIVDATRDPFTDYMENQIYPNLSGGNYVDGQKYKFTDTGFEFLAGGSDVNGSGGTYIYMAFKGSYSDYVAPINTDGTTTSRVKANTEKGFSIVRWQNVVDGTVGHGLNSAPEVILQKELENAVLWRVFHYLMTGSENYNPTDNLHLNENYAYPPAVGPASRINDVGSTTFKSTGGFSGTDQIAYCFHSVAGYSKFGSYVGNGSTSGTVVNTGFRPGFVLLKSVDSTSSWIMVDAVRDPDNLVSQYVYADLTSADATYTNIMEFTDTGFELRIAGGASNTNGQTYIYMAFADTRDAQFNFDASGNKNNFIPSGNINSNAPNYSSYDIMTDVPTLTDEDAGNYCTWSPIDIPDPSPNTYTLTLSNGNLTTATGGSEGVVNNTTLATFAIPTSGKWYWEITPTNTATAAATRSSIGIMNQAAKFADGSDWVYADVAGVYAYVADGRKWDSPGVDSGSLVSYGDSWTNNDVIGVAVDSDSGKIWFAKNGTWQASGDPEAGTNEAYGSLDMTEQFQPGVGYWLGCDANFGQRPFAYTPPTGFKKLNTYNLPDSTIENGSEHFNTVTFNGTGATGNAITGLGFQPDMVWAKSRSVAANHELADIVRGTSEVLFPNLQNIQLTDSTRFESFDSDGFTLGANSNANGSGYSSVGWAWKANGSGSSNSAGTNGASIASTYSANTTSGVSIVTYSGTGSNGTVYHGLGSVPEMMIFKTKTGAVDNWFMYHVGSNTNPASTRMLLNLTNTRATNTTYLNATAPAANVLTVGTDSGTNLATNTYVAYVFAPVEGFSAFGSYTGNGSADGPFIYTGFRPAWWLVKHTTSTESWYIFDAERSTYNAVNDYLLPNASNAEGVNITNRDHDFLSNGFKIRGTNGAINTNGSVYIYAAFAENPFKNSLAR